MHHALSNVSWTRQNVIRLLAEPCTIVDGADGKVNKAETGAIEGDIPGVEQPKSSH